MVEPRFADGLLGGGGGGSGGGVAYGGGGGTYISPTVNNLASYIILKCGGGWG